MRNTSKPQRGEARSAGAALEADDQRSTAKIIKDYSPANKSQGQGDHGHKRAGHEHRVGHDKAGPHGVVTRTGPAHAGKVSYLGKDLLTQVINNAEKASRQVNKVPYQGASDAQLQQTATG